MKTRLINKCLIFMCALLLSTAALAQEDEDKEKWVSTVVYGVYFSPVDGKELNDIVEGAGFGSFAWSSVGASTGGVAQFRKHNVLFFVDVTFKLNSSNGYRNSTLNIDFPLSYGYTVFDSNRMQIFPFVGIKSSVKGFWINQEDDVPIGQYLNEPARDYNFFSAQLNGILGAQFFYKTESGIPILALSAEYSVISGESNYFRYNSGLDGSAVAENLFTVRLGIAVR